MSFFNCLALHACLNGVNCEKCQQTEKLFFDEHKFSCFCVTKEHSSLEKILQLIKYHYNFSNEYFIFSDDTSFYIIMNSTCEMDSNIFIKCDRLIFKLNEKHYIMKNYFLLLWYCNKKFHLKITIRDEYNAIFAHCESIMHHFFEINDIEFFLDFGFFLN